MQWLLATSARSYMWDLVPLPFSQYEVNRHNGLSHTHFDCSINLYKARLVVNC